MEIVRKLGVLLRIAECLDRSGLGVVTGINCDVLGDSVIMKTEINGDAALEVKQERGRRSQTRGQEKSGNSLKNGPYFSERFAAQAGTAA